jgi:NAD-dependent dihydropyrimidine dehydrogenase PreA subunit
MGHITSKNYFNLQKRLDEHPQGAPESESLFRILEILFTEEEAGLISKLPIKSFTAKKASKIWHKKESEAKKILDTLADKGLLLDMSNGKEQIYVLAPTMAGFFEFSLMRTDGKFDRKLLSELYYKYINEEDRFITEVFSLNPSIARTLVHEESIQPKDQSIVLDYERATHIIKTSKCITVGTCYCRHKMEHMGKACDMPQDVCMTFNNAAKSLSKHGIAKEITKEEAMKVLDKCVKLGLVQIGDNIQEGVNWICNCCGCCCEAILAYKKLDYKMKLKSNFYAVVDDNCIGCGICVKRCPVDALKIIDIKDEKAKKEKKTLIVDLDKCIGCGVCERFCPKKSIKMERKKDINFVPKDSFERCIMTAIDNGKLQNLIFDNYNLWTNNLFRELFRIILKAKPIKRRLAGRQLQSKFINKLTKTYYAINKQLMDGKHPDYSHPEMNWNKK